MKIMIVNDIHLSDRPPSSCTDSYLDDLFDLLAQTAALAAEHAVDAVVWAGDVFHHKAPSRTSHRTVLRAIEAIRAYPCPVYIVAGNHDVRYDRLSSIDESQPLGVLYQAGAINLRGWADQCPGGGALPLYGVPWLQDWETLPDELAAFTGRMPVEHRDQCLVVTHCSIFPPGQEPIYEHVLPATWAELLGGVGNVAYGHIHESHGVYVVGGTTFANFGALSRGSLHEYNLTREVSVTLWDQRAGFSQLPLSYRPAAEVYRLIEAAQARTASQEFTEFLTRIGTTTVDVTSVESVIYEMRTRDDLEPALIELVEELLVAAAT